MKRILIVLVGAALSSCVTTQCPRTLVELNETINNTKTGVITTTNLKVSLEKEFTADDLAASLSKKNGFSLAARHLESRNVEIIQADTQHIAAVGVAGGNMIQGVGKAAGSAASIVIGTEGLTAASVGLSDILKSKLNLDSAKPK